MCNARFRLTRAVNIDAFGLALPPNIVEVAEAEAPLYAKNYGKRVADDAEPVYASTMSALVAPCRNGGVTPAGDEQATRLVAEEEVGTEPVQTPNKTTRK